MEGEIKRLPEVGGVHLFYHTEGKMREEGVEWDGVVYGMDIGEWGSYWLEEDGLWEVI